MSVIASRVSQSSLYLTFELHTLFSDVNIYPQRNNNSSFTSFSIMEAFPYPTMVFEGSASNLAAQ
jgi:hypothetical protein